MEPSGYDRRMIEIDHRRTIAQSLIQGAGAIMVAAEAKGSLDASEAQIIRVALKKLANVARSLSSTNPLGDDDAAAKLTAIATTLMNCNDPDLKGGAYSEITKAAKIFDEFSQGI